MSGYDQPHLRSQATRPVPLHVLLKQVDAQRRQLLLGKARIQLQPAQGARQRPHLAAQPRQRAAFVKPARRSASGVAGDALRRFGVPTQEDQPVVCFPSGLLGRAQAQGLLFQR